MYSNKQLLKIHIYGSKDYIHSEIMLWKPKTIQDIRQEEKLIKHKNKFNNLSFTKEDENGYHDPEKRAINKCRYCDDKWSPRHINNKKLCVRSTTQL